MQKTAQKRDFLNKLKEYANIPKESMENFFKPEMKRVMDALRVADDNIRTILSGEKIPGSTITPENDGSLKEILKDSRRSFNRREYMTGIADLGRFHKSMYDVSQYINTLKLNVDKIHHNFLFQGLKDKDHEKLKKLHEHMSKSASAQSEYFIKEAGIMDFFHNIGTQRGRALAAWEKKYPNKTKELREGGTKLLDQADNVLANTLSILKEMATFRATARVDNYVASAQSIQKEYSKFDAAFRAYYNNVVQPWLVQFDKWQEENGGQPIGITQKPTTTTTTTNAPVGTSGARELTLEPGGTTPELAVQPTPAAPAQAVVTPVVAPPGVDVGMRNPNAPPPPGRIPAAPEALQGEWPDLTKELPATASHKAFYNSLQALSNEDPRILSSYISKYAKSIQKTDLETAITLFNIAAQLKK